METISLLFIFEERNVNLILDTEKIGFSEALCAVTIVMAAHLILLLPKYLIQSQGSASLINVIYITIISLLAIFTFNRLYKNFKGKDILDISKFLLGNHFRFIIGIIYIVYLLFVVSLCLRITAENLKSMYFHNTPTIFLLFFLLLAIGYVNRYGFKTVIKCNLIILPLIFIASAFLFALSIPNFTFERIFPILGNGFQNTFLTGAFNTFCFSNILLLFFMMPYLKEYHQFSKLSYASILLSGALLFAAIAAIVLLFPISISSGSNIPIYLQSRSISFGKLFQRIDTFFVLIWILCVLSYGSIILSFMVSIFCKIAHIETRRHISSTFTAIIFGFSMLYTNVVQARQFDFKGYRILSLSIAWWLGFLILILSNIKMKRKKYKC